jgi:hypothetical protein
MKEDEPRVLIAEEDARDERGSILMRNGIKLRRCWPLVIPHSPMLAAVRDDEEPAEDQTKST